jgi:hypothetical protein
MESQAARRLSIQLHEMKQAAPQALGQEDKDPLSFAGR